MEPKVVLGVLSYNNERFIERTLLGVLNQTYKNLEIVIHDDCSTDDSVLVIKSIMNSFKKGKKIKLICSDKNLGICKSLNRIIKDSSADYYCFIGSDDYYLPNFVKNRVDVLERISLQYGVCYSLSKMVDESDHFVSIEQRPATPSGYIFHYLLSLKNQSLVKPLSCFYRGEVFDKVGLFDEELLFEDLDFLLRVSKVYKFYYLEAVDAVYRIRKKGSLGSFVYSLQGVETHFKIYEKHKGVSKNVDKLLDQKKFFLIYVSFQKDYPSTMLKRILDTISQEKYCVKYLFWKIVLFFNLRIVHFYKVKNILPEFVVILLRRGWDKFLK